MNEQGVMQRTDAIGGALGGEGHSRARTMRPPPAASEAEGARPEAVARPTVPSTPLGAVQGAHDGSGVALGADATVGREGGACTTWSPPAAAEGAAAHPTVPNIPLVAVQGSSGGSGVALGVDVTAGREGREGNPYTTSPPQDAAGGLGQASANHPTLPAPPLGADQVACAGGALGADATAGSGGALLVDFTAGNEGDGTYGTEAGDPPLAAASGRSGPASAARLTLPAPPLGAAQGACAGGDGALGADATAGLSGGEAPGVISGDVKTSGMTDAELQSCIDSQVANDRAIAEAIADNDVEEAVESSSASNQQPPRRELKYGLSRTSQLAPVPAFQGQPGAMQARPPDLTSEVENIDDIEDVEGAEDADAVEGVQSTESPPATPEVIDDGDDAPLPPGAIEETLDGPKGPQPDGTVVGEGWPPREDSPEVVDDGASAPRPPGEIRPDGRVVGRDRPPGDDDEGGPRDGDGTPNDDEIESFERSEDAQAGAGEADWAGANANGRRAIRRMNAFYELPDVEAHLVVEEVDPPVIIAEPLDPWWRQRRVGILLCLVFLLVASLSITLAVRELFNVENTSVGQPRETPTLQPTSSPTFDPRPTIEIAQGRGHIICGLDSGTIDSGKGFYLDVCRAVAAVVIGSSGGYRAMLATSENRWRLLHERTVDLNVRGETHNVEREVREITTGAGFAFSSVYNYDGMVYLGIPPHVRCAERQRRHGECASLSICVQNSTTHLDFLRTRTPFPPSYLRVTSSVGEMFDMLLDGRCNVVAADRSRILSDAPSHEGVLDVDRHVLGSKALTKEPLAIATRKSDREFSLAVDLVVQTLKYGEEMGIGRDPSLCRNDAAASRDASGLDYANAVRCVGNYGEIFEAGRRDRGMNGINNGTGMIYAIPFGSLSGDVAAVDGGRLAQVWNEGSFNCGLAVPAEFSGSPMESDKLVGMGADYCRALAAALFVGDSENVNILTYPVHSNGSFEALNNGTIDVLVGARVRQEYHSDVSPLLRGLHFSTPYYYENENSSINNVNFVAIATRDDDAVFSSFVNCIVLATIHAQENGIGSDKSREMPLVSLFGSHLKWALWDAITYGGNYGQIYARNFGKDVLEASMGRNALNEGGPMMLAFPHHSLLD